ncbi:hypothetical protein HK102_008888, partial [Quaeritorhiza haematococci]
MFSWVTSVFGTASTTPAAAASNPAASEASTSSKPADVSHITDIPVIEDWEMIEDEDTEGCLLRALSPEESEMEDDDDEEGEEVRVQGGIRVGGPVKSTIATRSTSISYMRKPKKSNRRQKKKHIAATGAGRGALVMSESELRGRQFLARLKDKELKMRKMRKLDVAAGRSAGGGGVGSCRAMVRAGMSTTGCGGFA